MKVLSILALTVAAIKVREEPLNSDLICIEEGLLEAPAKANSTQGLTQVKFAQNVPGYYDISAVREFKGDEALKVFKTGQGIRDHTILEAYHPQCGHCHHMAPEYIKFAEQMKSQNADVDVVSINASFSKMEDLKEMDIKGYPMVFYHKNGKFNLMENVGRDVASWSNFLKH